MSKWKEIESYMESKSFHESKFNITKKQAQMILDLKKDELEKMRFLAMLDIDKDEVKQLAKKDPSIMKAIGRQGGEAIAAKVDTDLAALFAGFSNTVGSGAAEITASVIFQAAATLRNNNAPGPYYCVLAPFQAMALKQQLAGTGNTNMGSLSDIGNQALRDGFIGTLAGMQIFESSKIANDPSAGGVIGAAFSRDSLAYVNKRPLRLETERSAKGRSTDIVLTHAFGVSELIDAYGVGIIGDNQV